MRDFTILSDTNAMMDKGHRDENRTTSAKNVSRDSGDFVLEKDIFSNIFSKDIRRVFIYKKAERLAKAIHLISPAFVSNEALRQRLERVSVGLIDAAVLPPHEIKDRLSRELLALSSILAVARASGLLSSMNASLIGGEVHALLGEVASYEEPQVVLGDSPTISSLQRRVVREPREAAMPRIESRTTELATLELAAGGSRDSKRVDAILSVIKDKGRVFIKDISVVIRDVSEKTIQRELKKLVLNGTLVREGDRRWTAYSLASKE